jgi:hypothetical protein
VETKDIESRVFKGESKSCEEAERLDLSEIKRSCGLLIGIPFLGVLKLK